MNRRGAREALFVDFDGTIMKADTARIALDCFGDPEWKRIDEALENGDISFEDSLRREFATLRARPETIIQEVSRRTEMRPNFDRLVEYCKRNDRPLKVVSGGLDFIIRHFLDRNEWLNFIEIHAPKSRFTGNGYSLTFPSTFSSSSMNFKDDLVRREREDGTRVVFVGNGFGDFSASKESDLVFAIRGSRLAELLREHGFPYRETDDFQQVVDALNNRMLEVS